MNIMSDFIAPFYGVVENNNDPLMQGRVQVRVIGVHPFKRAQDDIDGMSVEDLPWMSVVLPVTSATISGIGSSPVGLLNGSHVFGLWVDKYKTNGIVTGSLPGYFAEKPNPDEGFSDPSGTYPTSIGPTTANLNLGGTAGVNDSSNVDQNGSMIIGINPGGIPGGGAPSSIYNESLSEQMISKEEGRRTTIYPDVSGWSIGIGHLCIKTGTKAQGIANLNKQLGRSTGGVITSAEIDKLFKADLVSVRSNINKVSILSSVYNAMNGSRRMALENMVFQMGAGGVANFTTALNLMLQGKYEDAAKQLLQSKWAKQTPGRAARIASIIKYGNLSSYGISSPGSSGSLLTTQSLFESKLSVRTMLASFSDFSVPSNVTYVSDADIPKMPTYEQPAPLVDQNGVINGISEDTWSEKKPDMGSALFQQPPSSYNGTYPHVKATVTPSGHITEFDDTPGAERFRQVHPTGTYTEVNPQGMHITKSKSDMYHISDGDISLYSAGDYKTNVSGDEIFYNLGNKNLQVNGSVTSTIQGSQTENIAVDSIQNVQGNETLYVKGNSTKTIDGDGTVIIKGNIKVIIQGNADIEVNGNTTQTTTGNYTHNIGGSYQVNANGPVNIVSSSVTTIDGTRVNFGD